MIEPESAFGEAIDYAILVKVYGNEPGAGKRYSHAICIGCKKVDQISSPRSEAHQHVLVQREKQRTATTIGFNKRSG
jgi:hypothetical protein